ncbi:MAG TPA: thiamine phosphate synthase [Gemmataceae bacterium]|nr:thiamine phosphate synthase [Gemmataceae bacterium]
MIPESTPAVLRALERAQRYATGRGAAQVEPLDLLHGLLEEEEGHAAALAANAGLDRAAYLRARGATASDAPSPVLPLHPRTGAALEEARRLARELTGEGSVSGESLLPALVRAGPELAGYLGPLGLLAERLESGVQAREAPPLPLEEPLVLADATERIDTARVLDAAANRAREGLRAVEDYCRFVLDDAFLTGRLKELRHGLAEALADLPPGLLLEARETERDIGTALSTPAEMQRTSLLDVARANLKRLQEALRTLEEFGKVLSPRLGQAVEGLRYRAYTLERAILLGSTARHRLEAARLYVLLSGETCTAALDWTIAEAAAGGAHVIQLREKGLSDRELLERARQVRQWTRQAGVLFILNDRPDLARLCEADGVHLGQDDLPVKEARRILGPDALVGVSTHNIEQVRQAVLDGASYIGVGPTFPSGTKNFAELAGPDFIRAAAAETTLPAFAIGGINRETIAKAVAAGAWRVAVSQAIARADDPRRAAAELLRLLERGAAFP